MAILYTDKTEPSDKVPSVMAVAQKAPNRYHHGDLRRALLEAVDEIVRELGVEGLSLRECARRAGVSHGAPAHHFSDKRGMLTEYATDGFERLLATIALELDKVGADDTLGRLKGVGKGYVAFALAHRAQFKVMFRSELLDNENQNLLERGRQVFELLTTCLAAHWARTQQGWRKENLAQISLAWSAVHGFAVLAVEADLLRMGQEGLLNPDPDAVLDQLLLIAEPGRQA